MAPQSTRIYKLELLGDVSRARTKRSQVNGCSIKAWLYFPCLVSKGRSVFNFNKDPSRAILDLNLLIYV